MASLLDGNVYFELECYYDSLTTNSTYVINSYLGSVIDLVSILVSAAISFTVPVSTFVNLVLQGAGILVVGGIIKDALPTVSSVKTSFTWNLVDRDFIGHTKTFVAGRKDVITETNYYTNHIFYDGLTPNDWGSQYMAIMFNDQMFAYYPWNVLSWS